jgi:hypothetical protein
MYPLFHTSFALLCPIHRNSPPEEISQLSEQCFHLLVFL